MAKKIWSIEFVAGNPDMFSQVRSTEQMAKAEALATWQRMRAQNPTWRMSLISNGANTKVVDKSEAQLAWERANG